MFKNVKTKQLIKFLLKHTRKLSRDEINDLKFIEECSNLSMNIYPENRNKLNKMAEYIFEELINKY